MAISRNGVTSVNGDTVGSMPTHAAGDLLIAIAYRTGSTVLPTVTSPWQTVVGSSGGANSNAALLAYKIAASSSETAPTFTNATQVIMASYSGVDNATPFGGVATAGSALANDLQYPALTMTVGNGSSWVVGAAGHRSGTGGAAVGTAPTGMTNVTSVQQGSSTLGSAGWNDTNAGVASWSLVTVASGTANGHRQMTLELIAASAAAFKPAWARGSNALIINGVG